MQTRMMLPLLTLLAFSCATNEATDDTTPDQDTDVTPVEPTADALEIGPGISEHTIEQTIGSADETRYFSVSAPDDYSDESNYPVLFILHGNASGDPQVLPEKGMLNAVASLVDDNKLVAIAPRGFDNCWQLGPENSSATTAEEVAFIEGLIQQIKATPGLDGSRIYAITSLGFANLQGANLWSADFRRANLSGADLRGVSLWATILEGVDLQGADLTGAVLKNRNLRDADLRGANLSDANLFGVRLKGASVQGAQYDESTRWPWRFDPIAAGAILLDGAG